jgi:hypothetical protein
MPGLLLHLGADVACLHQGFATPPRVDPRVLVDGQPVVPQPGPWVVAGCAMPPPPGGNGPCVTGQWVTGSVRVLASGQPLLILGGASVCAPTGTPLLVRRTQTRVVAT